MKELDLSKTFIGKVEDNSDPKRLGRCRIRVLDVFDNIPIDDIPWSTPNKDLNGNQFIVPEVGKIVSVKFEDESIYTPVYSYAQHYNINLEKKLKDLNNSGYTSMRALIFDHKSQVFSNDSDGLMMDYKFNQINVLEGGIDINLKDNNARLNLGTNNANQEAILGTNFLDWFDDFVDQLLGNSGGPYLGNLGAPVIANPAFINILLRYKALKDPKFLSDNVYIVDNNYVNKVDRIAEGQTGDEWRSTIEENELVRRERVDFKSKDKAGPIEDAVLTPASDGSETPITSDEELANKPFSKSGNPDVDVLLQLMNSKGYVVYTRPFEINTIGVRYQYEGDEYSNKFKDRVYALWKDNSGEWNIKYWSISTIPGRLKARGGPLLKDAVGPSRGGLGILKPAQYIDVYKIGYHRDRDPRARAMITIGRQLAYRDQNYGSPRITFSNEDPKNSSGGGYFAMFIHKAYNISQGANTYGVYNWSEGCQVFRDPKDLNEYFDLCERHKEKYGNKFTYTLVTSRDVEEARKQLERIEARRVKEEAARKEDERKQRQQEIASKKNESNKTESTQNTPPSGNNTQDPQLPSQVRRNNEEEGGPAEGFGFVDF